MGRGTCARSDSLHEVVTRRATCCPPEVPTGTSMVCKPWLGCTYSSTAPRCGLQALCSFRPRCTRAARSYLANTSLGLTERRASRTRARVVLAHPCKATGWGGGRSRSSSNRTSNTASNSSSSTTTKRSCRISATFVLHGDADSHSRQRGSPRRARRALSWATTRHRRRGARPCVAFVGGSHCCWGRF